jgi:PucR family transcriptional regulator, purine catabolism regulatory protein
MSEVTLTDFIAWEPTLQLVADPDNRSDVTPVAWVVAARTGIPMLPPLRGGEIVMLQDHVLEHLNEPLAMLLGELASLGVSAAMVTGDPRLEQRPPLPVLLMTGNGSPTDHESTLNRSLTELRGTLYRAGTELGRVVSRLSSAGASPEAFVSAARDVLGLEIELRHQARSPESSPIGERIRTLRSGLILAACPHDPRLRAMAELALGTLAEPLEEALRRAEDARPRGAGRSAAIGQLLAGSPERAGESVESLARRLALPVGSKYRAVGVSGGEPRSVAALLGRFGEVHDASHAGEMGWLLLELPAMSGDPAPAALSVLLAQSLPTSIQIAVSQPAGIAALAEAGAEVRFIAALQGASQLARRVVVFDDVPRFGPYRLLYAIRSSADLDAFAEAALGSLVRQDRRGELQRTLRVFLECGGAHGEAADRLGIHRNTLAYRLRRIGDLTGQDIGDPSIWMTLHLALLASAMPR